MNKIQWIIMALVSGAFLPIQAGLNSRLGKAVANPIYASLFSFIVGAIGLSLYILLSRQSFSLAGIKSAPASIWLGGLLGAFYVTVIILAFPHLGPGLTFGLVIAGQMLTSILLEHFNVLVAQQQNISLMKIVGVILVILGVVIIRKF
jgi:bacterial/archaeal transporter family-2 protein